jgi:hypothetical protein
MLISWLWRSWSVLVRLVAGVELAVCLLIASVTFLLQVTTVWLAELTIAWINRALRRLYHQDKD